MIVVHMNVNKVINPQNISFQQGISPQKKASMQNSNQNTNQKTGSENIERIQVTIPNPLLMPNASV